MIPLTLHDRAVIEACLRRDPQLHLYALGDLDDFFWPYTSWYGRASDGDLDALILVYTGGGLPIVLALAEEGRETLRDLITDCLPLLPRRFYCHLSPGLVDVLAGSYRVESHGRYLKMGLTNPGRVDQVDTSNVTQLTPSEAQEVTAFYDQAYPGNWFDPRMLETSRYYGARVDGRLVSVAGIHVYSPRYRAAALGNITTLPDYRGQGWGSKVTARLCQQLCGEIDDIGLNVKADNAPALKVYERLGFTPVAEYDEYMMEPISYSAAP